MSKYYLFFSKYLKSFGRIYFYSLNVRLNFLPLFLLTFAHKTLCVFNFTRNHLIENNQLAKLTLYTYIVQSCSEKRNNIM